MLLAISPSTPGIPASDLVDLCVAAEDLGYRAAWVAEVAGPEAFSLLGAVASRTKTLDLGVAVVPAMTRSPALLAMAAGTVSQLLGGRDFSLGIGSSSQTIVEHWHGAPFVPPLARVRESVEATRALLGGERGYDGSHVSVDRFRLASRPMGRVRVFVGALGPRMLRLAGAVGDGVCLNLMPPGAVPRQLAEVRRGAEAAGRELPDHFRVMARFHIVLTDDVESGRGLIREGFGPYFAQPVYNRFLRWLGHETEAAGISEAFAAGDRGAVAAAFTDAIVDGVSLVGGPAEVRSRLDEYSEAGVDIGALNVIGDLQAVRDGLGYLAPH
jgi:probable F420-dependent oxidoreductase